MRENRVFRRTKKSPSLFFFFFFSFFYTTENYIEKPRKIYDTYKNFCSKIGLNVGKWSSFKHYVFVSLINLLLPLLLLLLLLQLFHRKYHKVIHVYSETLSVPFKFYWNGLHATESVWKLKNLFIYSFQKKVQRYIAYY